MTFFIQVMSIQKLHLNSVPFLVNVILLTPSILLIYQAHLIFHIINQEPINKNKFNLPLIDHQILFI